MPKSALTELLAEDAELKKLVAAARDQQRALPDGENTRSLTWLIDARRRLLMSIDTLQRKNKPKSKAR
jgi:hypothetical protein